ncbi:hypothetical protein GUJ93_ZPchr0002g26481 [Zizania palustris]|uniref:Uncharacterized protein n=1 Tax=Zizania palustris TaxID=103762 RepID=A0A8J5S0W3_ZIZPA|nr:hypothetical protein GUJ93_ZPchr0002g26481 [Zizania palustris]
MHGDGLAAAEHARRELTGVDVDVDLIGIHRATSHASGQGCLLDACSQLQLTTHGLITGLPKRRFVVGRIQNRVTFTSTCVESIWKNFLLEL